MKKFIATVLSLAVSLTLIIPASAASFPDTSDDTIITFEEYYNAVKAEYAKHGIVYEVIENTNPDFVFTQKILDDKLSEIQSMEYPSSDISPAISVSKSSDSSASVFGYMPVERTYQRQFYVECPVAPGLAWAYICLEVVAQINAQNDNLMSIISYTSFQKGAYLNFVDWEQRDMEIDADYMNDTITATATGLLTVEYTEPTTGLLVGYTSEHTLTATFDDL